MNTTSSLEAYLKIGKAPIEAANYVKSKIEKELKAYNLQQSEKLRFSPKCTGRGRRRVQK